MKKQAGDAGMGRLMSEVEVVVAAVLADDELLRRLVVEHVRRDMAKAISREIAKALAREFGEQLKLRFNDQG